MFTLRLVAAFTGAAVLAACGAELAPQQDETPQVYDTPESLQALPPTACLMTEMLCDGWSTDPRCEQASELPVCCGDPADAWAHVAQFCTEWDDVCSNLTLRVATWQADPPPAEFIHRLEALCLDGDVGACTARDVLEIRGVPQRVGSEISYYDQFADVRRWYHDHEGSAESLVTTLIGDGLATRGLACVVRGADPGAVDVDAMAAQLVDACDAGDAIACGAWVEACVRWNLSCPSDAIDAALASLIDACLTDDGVASAVGVFGSTCDVAAEAIEVSGRHDLDGADRAQGRHSALNSFCGSFDDPAIRFHMDRCDGVF